MAPDDAHPASGDDLATSRSDAGGALLGDDGDGPGERTPSTVRYGIEQVADKVKGLLRSDR